MIEEASQAIEDVAERDRKAREAKYARRNKMRFIDRLLNELEMLNLAEQQKLPATVAEAVQGLASEADLDDPTPRHPTTVLQAMDLLYEIQDSLMYNQIEDE